MIAQAAAPPPPPPPLLVETPAAPTPPPPLSPPLPPSDLRRPSGRLNRTVRRPAKFKDAAPPRPPRLRRGVVPPASEPVLTPAPAPPVPEQPPAPPSWVNTEPNQFGLYKVYPRRPTHDPDLSITLDNMYEAAHWVNGGPDDVPLPPEPWYYPFPNASVAHLMKHHIEEEHPGTSGALDRLIAILQPDSEAESDGVNLHELPFPWTTKKYLDDLDKKGIEPLGVADNWLRGSVVLKLPCVGVHQTEAEAPEFTVNDILYRPLLDSIREVLQGPLFKQFHTTPFSLRFDPYFDSPDVDLDNAQPSLNEYGLPPLPEHHEDVFGELYTSAAMLEAYNRIPQPPPPQLPSDPVESIIVGIMEWSDATHLAQFGSADLWPGYTFFGNHPKDFRGKPSSQAGFHQVYFVHLPDSVRDAYREHYDRDMKKNVFTYLKRDLMHRIWELLLSGTHNDMVRRQTIRVDDHSRRNATENARKAIFEAGNAVEGGAIDTKFKLKELSWVPIRNAFSKLNTDKTPFNFYTMFVPDLLHEVELGVGKAVILHLIRLLNAFGNTGVFDQRFRQIETFGRGTIRSFHNVSAMRYAAARDFEDIIQVTIECTSKHVAYALQCILPVVEGLFPRHQKLVDLLCFELALWHGYAKLRMHTTRSVKLFRVATTDLLSSIRRFGRETKDVPTVETDQEEATRKRQEAAAAATKANQSSQSVTPVPSTDVAVAPPPSADVAVAAPSFTDIAVAPPPSMDIESASKPAAKPNRGKAPKFFSMNNYKLHAIGDYPDTVVRVGTMDSISTQNRRSYYKARQNKIKGSSGATPAAFSVDQGRKRRLRAALRPKPQQTYRAYVPPEQHHYISDSKRSPVHLSQFDDEPDSDSDGNGPVLERMDLCERLQDPALKDFVLKLKSHLRRVLLGLADDGQLFTDQQLGEVIIKNDMLYAHATMQVNYTTYDVRREQDLLNPRTRRFFIVHADDHLDPHRFWYGEIIGVYHTYVALAVGAAGPRAAPHFQRVQVLWVRWFQRDKSHRCGLELKRFPRVRYMPHTSADAFGFLDPQDVVRGAHLIPAFQHGRTDEYLPFKSIARRKSAGDEDWTFYYANMVVDRDMLMRYHDNVIGHRSGTPKPAPQHDTSQLDSQSDPSAMDTDPQEPPNTESAPDAEHIDDAGDGEEDDDWRGQSWEYNDHEVEQEQREYGEELHGTDALLDALDLAI
uniref:Uncharacterized protein n=1 Tax=Mycena chlorophos TaxID=658473 RepID=A0ABQ0LUI0_MYCCL|nr:predicted protein [Mycena chlorophos]